MWVLEADERRTDGQCPRLTPAGAAYRAPPAQRAGSQRGGLNVTRLSIPTPQNHTEGAWSLYQSPEDVNPAERAHNSHIASVP